MHATITLCLMMVGGPVAPEAEISTIPLSNDQTAVTALQDLQWQERAKHLPLPRVPTISDNQPNTTREKIACGGRQKHRSGSGSGSDPYSQRKVQSTGTMPLAPTDPGDLSGGRAPGGAMPAVPGQGLNQNNSQNRATSYNQNNFNQPAFNQPSVNGGYGYGGATTSAPRAQGIQTVDSIVSQSTAAGRNYGTAPNPFLNPSAGGNGGAAKPFSDYQRPNGYSPWQSLYATPTNNGTVSTYSSSVQPQMQQQQYNAQFSESIRGVQTVQNRLTSGTPGVEQQPGTGSGLVNPNSYINYGSAGIR